LTVGLQKPQISQSPDSYLDANITLQIYLYQQFILCVDLRFLRNLRSFFFLDTLEGSVKVSWFIFLYFTQYLK